MLTLAKPSRMLTDEDDTPEGSLHGGDTPSYAPGNSEPCMPDSDQCAACITPCCDISRTPTFNPYTGLTKKSLQRIQDWDRGECEPSYDIINAVRDSQTPPPTSPRLSPSSCETCILCCGTCLTPSNILEAVVAKKRRKCNDGSTQPTSPRSRRLQPPSRSRLQRYQD